MRCQRQLESQAAAQGGGGATAARVPGVHARHSIRAWGWAKWRRANGPGARGWRWAIVVGVARGLSKTDLARGLSKTDLIVISSSECGSHTCVNNHAACTRTRSPAAPPPERPAARDGRPVTTHVVDSSEGRLLPRRFDIRCARPSHFLTGAGRAWRDRPGGSWNRACAC
jgi:hypothetical protein